MHNINIFHRKSVQFKSVFLQYQSQSISRLKTLSSSLAMLFIWHRGRDKACLCDALLSSDVLILSDHSHFMVIVWHKHSPAGQREASRRVMQTWYTAHGANSAQLWVNKPWMGRGMKIDKKMINTAGL